MAVDDDFWKFYDRQMRGLGGLEENAWKVAPSRKRKQDDNLKEGVASASGTAGSSHGFNNHTAPASQRRRTKEVPSSCVAGLEQEVVSDREAAGCHGIDDDCQNGTRNQQPCLGDFGVGNDMQKMMDVAAPHSPPPPPPEHLQQQCLEGFRTARDMQATDIGRPSAQQRLSDNIHAKDSAVLIHNRTVQPRKRTGPGCGSSISGRLAKSKPKEMSDDELEPTDDALDEAVQKKTAKQSKKDGFSPLPALEAPHSDALPEELHHDISTKPSHCKDRRTQPLRTTPRGTPEIVKIFERRISKYRAGMPAEDNACKATPSNSGGAAGSRLGLEIAEAEVGGAEDEEETDMQSNEEEDIFTKRDGDAGLSLSTFNSRRDTTAEQPSRPKSQRGPRRILPGPAGKVQQESLARGLQDLGSHEGYIDSSAAEFIEKENKENGSDDEDFCKGPWLTAVDSLDGRSSGDDDWPYSWTSIGFIRQSGTGGRVDQIVGVISSIELTVFGDAHIILKDPTGNISASIPSTVLADDTVSGDLTCGAVLVLKSPVIFSPRPGVQNLNITNRNIVQVFGVDTPPPQNDEAMGLLPIPGHDNETPIEK